MKVYPLHPPYFDMLRRHQSFVISVLYLWPDMSPNVQSEHRTTSIVNRGQRTHESCKHGCQHQPSKSWSQYTTVHSGQIETTEAKIQNKRKDSGQTCWQQIQYQERVSNVGASISVATNFLTVIRIWTSHLFWKEINFLINNCTKVCLVFCFANSPLLCFFSQVISGFFIFDCLYLEKEFCWSFLAKKTRRRAEFSNSLSERKQPCCGIHFSPKDFVAPCTERKGSKNASTLFHSEKLFVKGFITLTWLVQKKKVPRMAKPNVSPGQGYSESRPLNKWKESSGGNPQDRFPNSEFCR